MELPAWSLPAVDGLSEHIDVFLEAAPSPAYLTVM
jgi:hypothetical protein